MKLPLVLVLGVVGAAVAFNQRMLDPLTTLLARELAVTPDKIVQLATFFLLPYALGQLFLGPLADAIGKAKVIKICVGVLIGATIASFFATGYHMLAALRFIVGLAAGGCLPVALALIADRTPVEKRQVAFSHLMIAMNLAQLFTAPVSAMISTRADWRGVLFVGILLGIIAWILLHWQVKPNPDLKRKPLSFQRSLATFSTILTVRRAQICYLAVFAEGIFIFAFVPHLALHFEQTGLGTVEETGYTLAVLGIGGLVYAGCSSWLVRWFTPYVLMGAGGGMIGFGLVLAALTSSWPAMAAALFIVGFAFYLLHSGLQTQVTEIMPEVRSSVVSLHAFSIFTGLAAGPLVFGWISKLIGFPWALALCGILIAIASQLAAWALSKGRRGACFG